MNSSIDFSHYMPPRKIERYPSPPKLTTTSTGVNVTYKPSRFST